MPHKCNFTIVEIEGDNQLDALVVLAKQAFAQQLAGVSGMTYHIIKGSDAKAGRHEIILGSDQAAAQQYDLSV